MEVISQEIQYGEFENGTLYCIKDADLYVFTISNYSWSLAVQNEKQLNDIIRMESSFQGFKENLLKAMKGMMKRIERREVKIEKPFGENLKELRMEKKLTLEELAEGVNKKYGTSFTKSMISEWESGGEVQLSSVKYLSLFFDVSLNEIMGFNFKDE